MYNGCFVLTRARARHLLRALFVVSPLGLTKTFHPFFAKKTACEHEDARKSLAAMKDRGGELRLCNFVYFLFGERRAFDSRGNNQDALSAPTLLKMVSSKT